MALVSRWLPTTFARLTTAPPACWLTWFPVWQRRWLKPRSWWPIVSFYCRLVFSFNRNIKVLIWFRFWTLHTQNAQLVRWFNVNCCAFGCKNISHSQNTWVRAINLGADSLHRFVNCFSATAQKAMETCWVYICLRNSLMDFLHPEMNMQKQAQI